MRYPAWLFARLNLIQQLKIDKLNQHKFEESKQDS